MKQKQLFKTKLSPQEKDVPSARHALNPSLKRPFKGAEDWQCSHYYFWWEYLRRHEGYKKCCQRGGTGAFSKLYADFGDVHGKAFTDWWEVKKELFVTQASLVFSTADPEYEHLPPSKRKYYVELPFDKSTLRILKDFIGYRDGISYFKVKTDKEPKYGIETRVPLRSLWEHLLVWDAKIAHPYSHQADLADIAGLVINEKVNGETVAALKSKDLPYRDMERVVRRRKQLAIQRHLRIAEQYVYNVGRGRFPLREGR